METNPQVSTTSSAAFKRGSTQRKGCMQPIAGGDHASFRLLPAFSPQRLDETLVFAHAICNHCRSISIRDFVSETGTNARLFHDICDDIQAAINSVRAGMVIDDAGRTVTYSISHKHLGTGSSILQRQEFIEPPPKTFKDL